MSRLRPVWRTLAPFLVLIAVWQIVSMTGVFPEAFFPSPARVAEAGWSMLIDGSLVVRVGITLQRLLLGALAGLIVGLALAMIFAASSTTWRFARPVVNYLEAMGEIGWLPIFVLWVGFGEPAIITTIAYTVAFPVLFGALRGFGVIPTALKDSVLTLGGSKRQGFFDVLLPGAAPGIITGFRIGMGFAWRTVILAEMLVAQNGLGVMLFRARSNADVDTIFVGMVVAGLLWTATDQLILKRVEARTVLRWGTQR